MPSRPITHPRANGLEDPRGRQMTKDGSTKRAALALVERGLATKAEAARLAGVSKQLMQHWARDIPIESNREATLNKLWDRFLARKSAK